MNEQTNGQTKVPCSTGLCPLWGRCSASSHSNLQWCKVGQRVSLTTYCPWATYWLLHIHNYNIFAFKPYFGEIWSVLNSFLMVHWSCAKFPALLPCFPPLKYTVKQSRAMGIANPYYPYQLSCTSTRFVSPWSRSLVLRRPWSSNLTIHDWRPWSG